MLWMSYSLPSLPLKCIDFSEGLSYVAIQKLVYENSNVHLITYANIKASLKHYTAFLQNDNPAFHRPYEISLFEQKDYMSITPACTEPYHSMYPHLKFSHRWYTGVNVGTSQDG